MQEKYGFTKIEAHEFEGWIASQSISRTCVRIQQHHTWKPRHSDFSGGNHFEIQNRMKRYHIDSNGWSDIGQHFSIFPDGVIITGRPLNKSPACIYGANSGAICIEILGNFDIGGDEVRSAQSDSIFITTSSLLKKIGIQAPNQNNVVYHHWYDKNGNIVYHNSGQKSCPGTAFFGGNQLSDFRENFLPKLQQVMGVGGKPPTGLLQWVVVTTDNLNVRNGPESSASLSNQQGPLPYGAVARVYEVSTNGWFRVSQSKQLWIYGRYTNVVQPATVNAPDTNARIGPGMEFDTGRIFQGGDKVFVASQNGEWCMITEELWIHRSILDFNV